MDKRTGTARDFGKGLRVTIQGAVLNIVLIILKLSVGVMGSSRALVADAAHSMSDLISDFVVMWGLIMGSRPSDESHHYGHAKLELLAEMILAMLLVLAGIGIITDSVQAFLADRISKPSPIVLPVAAFSVVAKEYLFRATIRTAGRTGQPSLVANAWHHRSDALTSLGVLAGAGMATLHPGLVMADALVGAVVAAVDITVGEGIGWEAAVRIVDTAPSRDYMTRMEEMILSVPRTRSVRDLKMRYVGRLIAAEVHLGLDPDMSVMESHDVAALVKRTVMERDRRVFDVVVHVEPEEGAGGPRNPETEKRRNGDDQR